MQMSHEVQKEVSERLQEPLDKKADITGKLALAKLKAAFNNATKSPVSVIYQSIRRGINCSTTARSSPGPRIA